MAVFANAFNNKPKVQFGSMNDVRDFIEVDASINENHSRRQKISQYTIEDGSNITDHAVLAPKKVTMQVEISEIPLSLLPSITGVAQGAVFSTVRQRIQGLGGIAASEGLGYLSNNVLKDKPNRMVNNLTQMERYMEQSELLFIRSGLTQYENMMIESVNIPRSADIGDTLVLNLTFTEVRIVTSETVELPEVKTKNVPSAASEQNSGKQKLEDPTAAEESRGSSSLFKLGKFSGVL